MPHPLMNATDSLARGTPATEGPLPANLAAALAAGLVVPTTRNGLPVTLEEQAELVAAFKNAMAGNPPDHPTLAVLQENPRALVPAGTFDEPTTRQAEDLPSSGSFTARLPDATASAASAQVPAGDGSAAAASNQPRPASEFRFESGPGAPLTVPAYPILQGPAASPLTPASFSDRPAGTALPVGVLPSPVGSTPVAATEEKPTFATATPVAPSATEFTRFAGPTPFEAKSVAPDSERNDSSRDETASADSETLGAAVLQSMLAQGMAAAAPNRAPAAVSESTTISPAARLEKLEQIVAETVSRVLVSDPLHDGNREVRVEFARDVLPDTAVRLWREAGRLHVEFISTTAVADTGLREGLPRLAAAIQRQDLLVEAPVVSLRLDSQAGQPGDGRSRQQYYPTLDENGEMA